MIIFRLTCLVGYPRTSAPEPIMGDTGKHSSAWCLVFDSFVVILQPVRRQCPENDNKLLPGRNAKSDNNNKRQ